MCPDPLLGIQNFISRQRAFILWPFYEPLNVTCLPFCFAAQAFLPISPAVQLLYLQHDQTKMAKLARGLQSEEEEGEALIPHPCSGEKSELLSARASPRTHRQSLHASVAAASELVPRSSGGRRAELSCPLALRRSRASRGRPRAPSRQSQARPPSCSTVQAGAISDPIPSLSARALFKSKTL